MNTNPTYRPPLSRKNLEVQVETDDQNIRKVIAAAEEVAGIKCFMPWTAFVIGILRGEHKEWTKENTTP